MESDNIEQLIANYFEATTTVTEEEELRAYFSSTKVAPHLKQYVPMFTYFANTKEERFTKEVPFKDNKHYLKWVSIAAVAVFIIGFYVYRPAEAPVELADAYTQEEIESAQQAFALLAMNFNKGTEQLYHLEEFEKTTNKFLIKE